MTSKQRTRIIDAVAPWAILIPIALGLGTFLEPFLHLLVYGTPMEKVVAMMVTIIVVLVAALALNRLGEKLARH